MRKDEVTLLKQNQRLRKLGAGHIIRRKYTPEEKVRIVPGELPSRGADPRFIPA